MVIRSDGREVATAWADATPEFLARWPSLGEARPGAPMTVAFGATRCRTDGGVLVVEGEAPDRVGLYLESRA